MEEVKSDDSTDVDSNETPDEAVKLSVPQPGLPGKQVENPAEDANLDSDSETLIAGEFDVAEMDVEEALAHFRTSRDGLSTTDATARLAQYGPNCLPEVKVRLFFPFLSSPRFHESMYPTGQ